MVIVKFYRIVPAYKSKIANAKVSPDETKFKLTTTASNRLALGYSVLIRTL